VKLSDLAIRCHAIAKEKGWWDEPREDLEVLMLVVTELSEAVEAIRDGKEPRYYEGDKPCGAAVECADALIRLLDFTQSKGWDIEDVVAEKLAYNQGRPYRHGGKKK